MKSTLPRVIVVNEISVHVATGETCYPGEGGFGALWAEVRTNDPAVKDQLEQATSGGQTVAVRCATLDVIGYVTRQELVCSEHLFVLRVSDLVYNAPGNTANGA